MTLNKNELISNIGRIQKNLRPNSGSDDFYISTCEIDSFNPKSDSINTLLANIFSNYEFLSGESETLDNIKNKLKDYFEEFKAADSLNECLHALLGYFEAVKKLDESKKLEEIEQNFYHFVDDLRCIGDTGIFLTSRTSSLLSSESDNIILQIYNEIKFKYTNILDNYVTEIFQSHNFTLLDYFLGVLDKDHIINEIGDIHYISPISEIPFHELEKIQKDFFNDFSIALENRIKEDFKREKDLITGLKNKVTDFDDYNSYDYKYLESFFKTYEEKGFKFRIDVNGKYFWDEKAISNYLNNHREVFYKLVNKTQRDINETGLANLERLWLLSQDIPEKRVKQFIENYNEKRSTIKTSDHTYRKILEKIDEAYYNYSKNPLIDAYLRNPNSLDFEAIINFGSRTEEIEDWLKNNPNKDLVIENLYEILIQLSSTEQINILKALESKENVFYNIVNYPGEKNVRNSLIYSAIEHQELELARFIIDSIEYEMISSLVVDIVKKNDFNQIKSLTKIIKNIDFNSYFCTEDCYSALATAITECDDEIIKFVIKHSSPSDDDFFPIAHALDAGNETLKLLFEKGFIPDPEGAESVEGESIFEVACRHHDVGTIQTLIDYNTDLSELYEIDQNKYYFNFERYNETIIEYLEKIVPIDIFSNLLSTKINNENENLDKKIRKIISKNFDGLEFNKSFSIEIKDEESTTCDNNRYKSFSIVPELVINNIAEHINEIISNNKNTDIEEVLSKTLGKNNLEEIISKTGTSRGIKRKASYSEDVKSRRAASCSPHSP